jgi:aconitate hydratase
MVYLQFEAMEIPRIRTELSVSYVDHNTLQSDYRNMDDHIYLQDTARKYGLSFSRPGNGICHQVHLERFGVPGKTLLGSDSHTPTGGGLGMIAIGAGGLDVAVAMAGAPFYMTRPEIVGVKLTGELGPMCSAKDVILELLKRETVKGGVGKIYEYFGEGVATLSVPERATITNMGAELGATTSLFPSDRVTRDFLEQQGRAEVWQEVVADTDAVYARVVEIDLSKVEPLAAAPHMPDNVVPIRELEGKRVDQVAIGSCTNSSINDLGVAADILDGNVIAPNVSLGVSPGSRQTLENSIEAGIVDKLVKSGARILESACGPCIGMGFAPSSKGVSVRTFNRNFKGRSGTADAEIYLVSPETAAAAALKGEFFDPRKIEGVVKKDYTSYIEADENLILPPLPPEEATDAEVRRGPNIQRLPKGEPVQEHLEAKVLIKTGDNITTDDIIPAGSRILPLRSNIPEISKYVFEALKPDFHKVAEQAGKGIIVGGENYGQGSSREHAALAPMYLGVKVVIAKSFARIHKANLINFGIIPLVFAEPADYQWLEEDQEIVLPRLRTNLEAGGGIKLQIPVLGRTITTLCEIDERSRRILLAGGLLAHTKERIREEG